MWPWYHNNKNEILHPNFKWATFFSLVISLLIVSLRYKFKLYLIKSNCSEIWPKPWTSENIQIEKTIKKKRRSHKWHMQSCKKSTEGLGLAVGGACLLPLLLGSSPHVHACHIFFSFFFNKSFISSSFSKQGKSACNLKVSK